MLAEQLLSGRFGWSGGIALLVMGMYAAAARHYNRSGQKTVPTDAFRAPVSHLLSSLGILVPIVIGTLGFLFERDPEATFGFLLAAAAVWLVGFLVLTWLTFAIISRSNANNAVVLNFPDDWHYLAAPGIGYASLLLGITFFCLFFLVEFRPTSAPKTVAAGKFLVERPAPRVGETADTVSASLGQPIARSADDRQWTYRTDRSTLTVTFDAAHRAVAVREALEE